MYWMVLRIRYLNVSYVSLFVVILIDDNMYDLCILWIKLRNKGMNITDGLCVAIELYQETI